MWIRYFLTPFLIVLFADTTPAGIFKKNTPKPDPSKHVPELIAILKTDKDESKRSDAANELRDYDPKAFPEILPALIDALQNDPATSVRTEAVNAISKLRPITQQAGYALEQALANDSSIRVRVAARTTLWHFHLLGYRSGKPPEADDNQSKEPPLATPKNPTQNIAPRPQSPSTQPNLTPQQPKQSTAPLTPKVQPPLLTLPPQLPPTKTNPLSKPTPKSSTPPINQSAEPPLAQPMQTKQAPTKPLEIPQAEPQLVLPSAPPSLIEIAPKAEKSPPSVTTNKPVETKKTEEEGPILTPPKN